MNEGFRPSEADVSNVEVVDLVEAEKDAAFRNQFTELGLSPTARQLEESGADHG